MIPLNKIILGDCIKVLKDFPENSIDCIVTDPPYGMSFMGKEWDKALPPKQAFIEMNRVLKPGALAFVMSSPRQDLMWRMAQLLEESGFMLSQSFISWVYASGFPKAYDISKGIDNKLGEKRKNFKSKKDISHIERGDNNIENQNYQTRDTIFTNKNTLYDSDPFSDEAKQWSGWKNVAGLKPALEVIFMVQKPLSEKTIVDNVLKHGVGAINVDACRIPIDTPIETGRGNREARDTGIYGKYEGQEDKLFQSLGRFPANLLVSDDALNDGKNHPSGNGIKQPIGLQNNYGIYNKRVIKEEQNGSGGDSGSFSRYFDLDAWAKHHGFLNVPKASTSERDQGLDAFEEKEAGMMEDDNYQIKTGAGNLRDTKRKNFHPTVKPIELMAYLIELGCPPDGVVLDPFLGSGTTCVAARMLGRDYIGIEISEEYYKIAEARVKSTTKLIPLDKF